MLQPGALPDEARLSASLGALRGHAAAQELRQEAHSSGALAPAAADLPEEDFADVVLRVEVHKFRCLLTALRFKWGDLPYKDTRVAS